MRKMGFSYVFMILYAFFLSSLCGDNSEKPSGIWTKYYTNGSGCAENQLLFANYISKEGKCTPWYHVDISQVFRCEKEDNWILSLTYNDNNCTGEYQLSGYCPMYCSHSPFGLDVIAVCNENLPEKNRIWMNEFETDSKCETRDFTNVYFSPGKCIQADKYSLSPICNKNGTASLFRYESMDCSGKGVVEGYFTVGTCVNVGEVYYKMMDPCVV